MSRLSPVRSALWALAAVAVWLLLGERRPTVLGGVAIGWAVGLMLGAFTTQRLGMPWSDTPLGWSTEHLASGIVTGLIFVVAVIVAGLPGLDRRSVRVGSPTSPVLGALETD